MLFLKNKCVKCGTKAKIEDIEVFGVKGLLEITYCPKCEAYQSILSVPVSAFKGTALRGINKKSGEFRLKIEKPEEHAKREIVVKTCPQVVVTKPSELHFSGRRVYTTKERTALVYPELKRGDKVVVAGFIEEGTPLVSVLMKNETVGLTSCFIKEKIKLKKGFMTSFFIDNPVLAEAEKLMAQL